VRLLAVLCLIVCTSLARAAEPAQALRDAQPKALDVLLKASRGNDPFLRANAIEAMRHAPDRVLPVCELGLKDEHPVVRFAALVTIGKLKAASMMRAAEAMTSDPHPSVRIAAYFAANQCGSPINVTPIASALFDTNPDVRANAAMLLGLMGDSSAGQMLAEVAGKAMPQAPNVKVLLVNSQVAEAQVRLGDRSAIDVLRAGVFSHYPEVRILCVTTLGELGDVPHMEDALFSILNDDQEVLELRLATAAALVKQSRPVVVKEVLDRMGVVQSAATMGEPAFRAQAAVTLGAIERARARVRPLLLPSDPPHVAQLFNDPAPTATLIGLLDDADGRVRVAAAAGVLAAR